MSFLSGQKLKDLGYIFSRNVFLLTNGIILVVVVSLFFFGDTLSGLFLGFVLVVNMSLGLVQDIRAWLTLEKLQLLTAPHVTRIAEDKTETSILIDEIQAGDLITLKIGDQIPCDGILTEAQALELNEGLITGESTSLSRKEHDPLLAGSIVTSGTGIMRVTSIFKESRIARMTEGIKSYSVTQSPIQRAVSTMITYSGYVLLLAIVYIVTFGVHQENVLRIKEIGALASTLVPQGLAFAMTLLFSYGAVHLFRRNVLLQEVNATEKLGRIKNLCLDKTGTLTENTLVVERIALPMGVEQARAELMASAYMVGTKDSSQTMLGIKDFIHESFAGNIQSSLSFSSWRSYGAVCIEEGAERTIILAGAPETLISYIPNKESRAWLQDLVDVEAKQGKRVFCIAQCSGETVPTELSGRTLSPVAVFIFSAKLRVGIQEAINFFQARGVRIRIISGDHPETVRAIAVSAGVVQCDRITTGKEMETWTLEDFKKRASEFTIFARTLPEQKEKIIDALKLDGFTAMVGDGANDALAIKKADLGIAMWDGAPATRQIASVVLMNNSFTALPGGVELADSIIKNAEIFASIFLEFSFVGFFLFLMASVLGYPYPLSPLNITLINYFTVGIPGILVSYWTLRPAEKSPAPSGENFFAKILPFTIVSALLQAVAIGALFILSPESMKTTGSNLFVLMGSILVGSTFFFFTPRVFRGTLATTQVRELLFVIVGEVVLLIGVFHAPLLLKFFDVHGEFPPISSLAYPIFIFVIYVFFQYVLARGYRVKA